MQGIFVNNRRPKSKKEIKEIILEHPEVVSIEATSIFEGSEFNGLASDLPVGSRISFVGPDPYTSRKFYGTIENHPTKGLRIS